MRHVIWIPKVNEELPPNTVAYEWGGDSVVAAIVPDDFATPGTVLYDPANGITAGKPLVHTFAGW